MVYYHHHSTHGSRESGKLFHCSLEQRRLLHTLLGQTEQHPLFLNPRLWSEFDRNKIKILRNPSEFNYALQQYLLSYFCIALYCTV